jgi:hypothetical protein
MAVEVNSLLSNVLRPSTWTGLYINHTLKLPEELLIKAGLHPWVFNMKSPKTPCYHDLL